jgi:hypothetical protein
MRKYGLLEKITIMPGLSNEFTHSVNKINMLFIDGDHSKEWCELDYNNYSPILLSGGYLLLHDFDDSRRDLGPTWVVNNLVLPSNEHVFVGLVDSLWISRKK